MVEVTVQGTVAVFEVQGSHKLWSLRSRLEVPLEHIIRAYANPDPAMGWFDGLKLAGADLPHLFRAGAFYLNGDIVFYDVCHPENTVMVDLTGEHFAKLIIEVADPAATVTMLEVAKR